MFLLLHRERHRLLNLPVRKRYGFLYDGFELHCYYFECIYMVRKLLIIAAANIPVDVVRTVILLILACSFFALHLQAAPFDDREFRILDRLEVLNLSVLNVTILAWMVI